ncbi:histidine kinase [Streptosporangium sp. NPDC000396]|uniref:sensor histidine kinase n=1 Tax=Streptosporangium sp. NPDC000396 TaxID=3366185 RepID=UPI0036A025A8
MASLRAGLPAIAGQAFMARLTAVAVFAAFATIYAAATPYGVLAALPAFLLQLPRHRTWWLVAAQGVVCFAGVLGLGLSVGLLGFLGGSLLLTRWRPLAVLVVPVAAWLGTLDAAISAALISLVIFGLTRLTERAGEMQAARLALAAAAVAEERLRIAAELNAGLGAGLAAIADGCRRALAAPQDTGELLAEVVATARTALAGARSAAAGYRSTSLTPELTTAKAMLTTAGVRFEVRAAHPEPLGPAGALLAAVLREAVTEVVETGSECLIETMAEGGVVRLRVTGDGAPTADDRFLAELPSSFADAGGSLTTGLTSRGRLVVEAALPLPAVEQESTAGRHAHLLAVVLLTVVLAGFSAKALLKLPAEQLLAAAALLGLVVYLQVRSTRGRHMVALAVMALLAFAPIVPFGMAWLGVAGFLAGPLPLAFHWALAWPLVAAVTGAVAVIGVRLDLPVPMTVNYAISTVVTGLVVYGLLRLAQVVGELEEARAELARSAVVEERLRAARDLHDLLGHSLAAILLSCELARRLGEPAEQLRQILTMTEQAEADLRAVSGEHHTLSFTEEVDSAQAVLKTAGIEVHLDLSHEELTVEAETTLSVVLREAVTNVLRHSSARRVEIVTSMSGGEVLLRVRNDGVRQARGRRGSSGIGNLTTRLAVLSGTLTTSVREGWFELNSNLPR